MVARQIRIAERGVEAEPGHAATSPDREARDILRRHPLFALLDAGDFDELCGRGRTIALKSRQLVFGEGELASRFFVVLRGAVKLYRITLEGAERVVDSVHAGQSIAESVIFAQDRRYRHHAETTEPSELVAFTGAQYRELVLRRRDYSAALLTQLADRLENRLRDLEVMTTQSARARVIGYLSRLLSDRAEGPAELELPLPKAALASRLAMQPETLSRILAELHRTGLLRMEKRRLLIDDVAGMRRWLLPG